ncbi:hypothetical protein BX666DRAFT_1023729 [Dichotomocladium elegans]|nr:hypothetical protein BX666DRAFT_1023729 [Dichotomocladium elegans]
MHYYHLRLAIVSLALPDAPVHLFDDHLASALPKVARHVKKPSPKNRRQCQSRLHHHPKSRIKQTIAASNRLINAPPTPIRSAKQAHSLRLTDQPDFRLGPLVVRTSTTDAIPCGYGILHLFRDARSNSEEKEENDKETSGPFYMSILAVPSYMAPAELLAFIGYQESNGCTYRFISDHSPNKYTAVFRFDSALAANHLFTKYNGKRLCITEPEICHVVYLHGEPVVDWMVIPSTKCPVSLHDTLQHDQKDDNTRCYELPTCPVCLERMDEGVTGLKKIVCEHTFDCFCLSKWGESDCPVCKYSQKPFLERNRPSGSAGNGSSSSSSNSSNISVSGQTGAGKPSSVEQDYHECFVCGATDSLWICMVCGHIGCGRYQDAHAYDHYRETDHLYVLEIETQHIWDYAGDGYVHSLIQNMVDGSLLELPSATGDTDADPDASGSSYPSGGVDEDGHARKDEKGSTEAEEKMDMMSIEYTYLLTSQLDSQRMYYEDQLEEIYHAIANLRAEAKNLMACIAESRNERESLTRKQDELNKQIAEISKEKAKTERRLLTWKAKIEAIEKEWKEEKELMKQLEGPSAAQQEAPASSDQEVHLPAVEEPAASPSRPISNSKKKGKRGNRS